MKDYSHLDRKTLFMHQTYLQDAGRWHEYFFGKMEATPTVVTANTEVSEAGGRYYVFEGWFVDSFRENTQKEEFTIGSRKFVPDYIALQTIDLRLSKSDR